jgi:hypothetical protein
MKKRKNAKSGSMPSIPEPPKPRHICTVISPRDEVLVMSHKNERIVLHISGAQTETTIVGIPFKEARMLFMRGLQALDGWDEESILDARLPR